LEIKQIGNCALTDVKKLVANVFMEFEAPDYSDEGIKTFFNTAINNPDYMSSLVIYAAYQNKKMVGVIATRNNGNHIALFFVDGTYHRQGIGRKLFETVLKNTTLNEITVNSSPYAKDVYHHLGFQDTDEEQIVTGIRFIPMLYRKRA
jgi:GNAT superfamily N-acetyltransferase